MKKVVPIKIGFFARRYDEKYKLTAEKKVLKFFFFIKKIDIFVRFSTPVFVYKQ